MKLFYLISRFGFDIHILAEALFTFLISIKTHLTKQLDFCPLQTDNGIPFPLLPGCCFYLKGDIGGLCGPQKAAGTEFPSSVPLGFA